MATEKEKEHIKGHVHVIIDKRIYDKLLMLQIVLGLRSKRERGINSVIEHLILNQGKMSEKVSEWEKAKEDVT